MKKILVLLFKLTYKNLISNDNFFFSKLQLQKIKSLLLLVVFIFSSFRSLAILVVLLRVE